ncbi:MAG: porin family protein [Tardiphaga sp.]|jgi:outer membrane immunogenic protein|nr:porin family protein [Tardiphaga sp.]
MKKAIGLACLLGLSGIGKGLAADLRGAAPVAQRQLVVPQLPSWAGLYVGVQAGHQSGGGDINVPATGEFHAVDPKSFIGGVMAGYAMQRGRVVGGLEGDINVLGGSALVDTGLAPDPAVTQLRTKMSWNGHLRGRLGYSFDQAMIFMAGGLALAGVENKAIDNAAGVTAIWNDTRAGWTLGGGVDYRIVPAMTVRLEYLYDNYGTTTLAAQTVGNVAFAERAHTLDTHTLRAGVNWRF